MKIILILKYLFYPWTKFANTSKANLNYVRVTTIRKVQCAGRHVVSDTVDRQVDGDLGESADAIMVNNGPSISHWSLSVAPDSQMSSHTVRLTFFPCN